MKRILPVLALLLSTSTIAHADLVGARCTIPAKSSVTVIQQGSTCRGYLHDTQLVLFDRKVSGTVLSSKDRRTVVVIEDYLPAVVEKKQVSALIGWETIVNPTVMWVYRDGGLVAAYDIERLVKDVTKVKQSISHVDWVGALPTSLDAKTFTLTTTSGRSIVFATATGTIRSEEG